MTMLPDIDQQEWDDFQGQQFKQATQDKIDTLGFSHQSDQQISSLGVDPGMQMPAPPPDTQVPGPAQMPQNLPPETLTLDQVQSQSALAAPAPAPAPDTFAPPETLPAEAAQGPSRSTAPPLTLPAEAAFAPQPSQLDFQQQQPGGDLQAYARQAAQKAGIDPDIFQRQIQQESGFNPAAKSGAGATGIAQFMPTTAAGMNVDPTDPYASLDGAARLMRQNLDKYGGSYEKALAAYNAGPGNVDRYGGVPPFEETQTYVKNILGGASPSVSESLGRTGAWAQQATPAAQISQFGDQQLSADEAYAACGPAAAVRFASMFGRNPTLREATDLAAQVGWTQDQGMAGIGSEQQLMTKLGIPTKLVGPDLQTIAQEAQTGNPVTISTPGHYFFADGYDPNSGAFHVGRSGTDLKGGSEWMTASQMQQVMGPIQGALLADNPQVPAKSTTQTYMSANQQQSPWDQLGSGIADAFRKAFGGGAQQQQASPVTGVQRMQPGSYGGPPDYTNYGQAAAIAAAGQPTGTERAITSGLQDLITNPRVQQQDQELLQSLQGQTPEEAQQQAWNQIPSNPLDLLGSAGTGAPTGGEILADERNRWIERNNPLRDQPFVGGATTLAAQAALDPTNLLLLESDLGRAGVAGARALGEEVGPRVAPAVGDFLGSEAGGFRIPGTSVTGPRYGPSRVLDNALQMFEENDQRPPVSQRAVDQLSRFLGLRGETGTIDKEVADRLAAINQVTGRARTALGGAFTPEMDAEAYAAVYPGRFGAAAYRAKELQPAADLVGSDLPLLNAYRKYQRDLEVANLRGGTRAASAGVDSAAIAQQGIKDIETEVGPQRFKQIQQADQVVSDALNRLLDDRVSNGLVDPELAQLLKGQHPHYNPTVVLKHLDDEGQFIGSGNRMQVLSNGLRRLAEEGSADNTEAPLRSAARLMMAAQMRMMQNDVARSTIRAALADPETAAQVSRVPMSTLRTGPEVSAVGGPAIAHDIATIAARRPVADIPGHIVAWENGKPQLYRVPQGIEDAIKGLSSEQINSVMKLTRAMNTPLRAGATWASARFPLTNALADAIFTYVQRGPRTVAGIPGGWWHALRQDSVFRDYARAGGLAEGFSMRSSKDLDRLITEQGGFVIPRDPKEAGRAIGRTISNLGPLRRINEIVEQGPHLAAYQRALAQGKSPVQAAMIGRRTPTDFSRGGNAAKSASNLMLFLNARTQGGLNLARALREDPRGASTRLASIAAAAVGLYKWNSFFPEEYADVPDSIKDQYAVMMLPGSVRNENGVGFKKLNYIAIPLRELATFTAPITYGLGKLQNQDPRSFNDFALSMLRTISPVSGDDPVSGAGGLIPAPIRAPMEIGLNRSFYTGAPIEPASMQNLPRSQRFDERTSNLARSLSEKVPWPQLSPKQWDFAIRENLGGLGMEVAAANDLVTGKPADTPPVLGGVLSGVWRQQGGATQQRQYEQLDRLMSTYSEPTAQAVMDSPEYQQADPEKQHQMLTLSQSTLEQHFRDELGIVSTSERGTGKKYVGVDDPKQEREIDSAISKVDRWHQNARNPMPSDEEFAMWTRYHRPVATTPEYRIGNLQGQENAATVRSLIDQLVPNYTGQ